LTDEYPLPLLFKLGEWAHENYTEERESYFKNLAVAVRVANNANAKEFKKYISDSKDKGGASFSDIQALKRFGKNGK